MSCKPSWLRLEKTWRKGTKTLVLMHNHIAGLVWVEQNGGRRIPGWGWDRKKKISPLRNEAERVVKRQKRSFWLDVNGSAHCLLGPSYGIQAFGWRTEAFGRDHLLQLKSGRRGRHSWTSCNQESGWRCRPSHLFGVEVPRLPVEFPLVWGALSRVRPGRACLQLNL